MAYCISRGSANRASDGTYHVPVRVEKDGDGEVTVSDYDIQARYHDGMVLFQQERLRDEIPNGGVRSCVIIMVKQEVRRVVADQCPSCDE